MLEGAHEVHSCDDDNALGGPLIGPCKVARSVINFADLGETGNPGPVGRALGVFCSRKYEELGLNQGSELSHSLQSCICEFCSDDCSKLELLKSLLTAHRKENEKSKHESCSCCYICQAVRDAVTYYPLQIAEKDAFEKEMCNGDCDSESDSQY